MENQSIGRGANRNDDFAVFDRFDKVLRDYLNDALLALNCASLRRTYYRYDDAEITQAIKPLVEYHAYRQCVQTWGFDHPFAVDYRKKHEPP